MGTWGTKIFDDDTACDVRDAYRELIEDGVDDAEAMRKVLEEYGEYFEDPEASMVGKRPINTRPTGSGEPMESVS